MERCVCVCGGVTTQGRDLASPPRPGVRPSSVPCPGDSVCRDEDTSPLRSSSPNPTAQSNHEKNTGQPRWGDGVQNTTPLFPQTGKSSNLGQSEKLYRPEGLGATGTKCNTAGVLDAILEWERVLENE